MRLSPVHAQSLSSIGFTHAPIGAFTHGVALSPEKGRELEALVGTMIQGSVGCIGNRVYTGLGDDEMYLTVTGPAAGPVIDALDTILAANRELETFHRARAAELAG